MFTTFNGTINQTVYYAICMKQYLRFAVWVLFLALLLLFFCCRITWLITFSNPELGDAKLYRLCFNSISKTDIFDKNNGLTTRKNWIVSKVCILKIPRNEFNNHCILHRALSLRYNILNPLYPAPPHPPSSVSSKGPKETKTPRHEPAWMHIAQWNTLDSDVFFISLKFSATCK